MAHYLILLLVVIFNQSLVAQNNKAFSVLKRSLSVEILWSGDFKSKLMFDGSPMELIKGEAVITDQFVVDKSCEVTARFEEVLYAKEKHLKVNFIFLCQNMNSTEKTAPKQEIKLSPEYVRLSDLKTYSSQVYISSKYPKNQFKIINLQY